jgi:hypothetical protein
MTDEPDQPTHPPFPAPPQPYPTQPYPTQPHAPEFYPTQPQAPEFYPTQPQAPEFYPTQSYPPQSYPPQSYPTQSYPPQPRYPAYPPPYQQYPPYPPPQPVYSVPSPYAEKPVTNTGPAACAFGLMALLLGWVPVFGIVGITCGVAGIVFALRALELAKLGFVSDRGLAIAGLVLACAGLAVGVPVNLVFLIAIAAG